jgi:uridine monophosphate synthetase
METFFSLLERHVQTCNSLLCVGLDPHPADLPAPTAEAALDFCLRLVKETSRYAAAFKPNAAFFEMFGAEGWTALKMVVEAVAEESHRTGSLIPVILDAKRGDIASTAEAYAASAFKTLGAHAITLSPYLGKDSIGPFIADRERGVFLLCKTSNPGAGDFQSLIVKTLRVSETREVSLFELVAERAQQWNINGNVGLVVGATYPDDLARVRALAPDLWFLVPGVGAQGGDLEKALAAGLRADGMGMLIAVSRGISRAASPGEEARRLRDEILEAQTARLKAKDTLRATSQSIPLGRDTSSAIGHPPSAIHSLAQDLLASGCVRFGQFTLKSGVVSPIYLDLRRLASHPAILRRVARAYAEKLNTLKFDRLAGIPYAGLPIATAVALEMNRPLIYPRREAKDYGTRSTVEGGHERGEIAVAVDDVVTTGGSKIEMIQKIEAAGLVVRDILVLIDREQGAKEILAAAGYTLHAVVTLRELLDEWRTADAITEAQFQEVMVFLKTR